MLMIARSCGQLDSYEKQCLRQDDRFNEISKDSMILLRYRVEYLQNVPQARIRGLTESIGS